MEKNLEKIRTIGLVAHSGAGKTSLGEALLFTTKTIDRLGRVDDGSSVLDFEPEELKRHLTINTSFHHYDWKKHKVFFADTPGMKISLPIPLPASRSWTAWWWWSMPLTG